MKRYCFPLVLLIALSLTTAFAQNTSSPYYHKFYDLHKKSWGPGYALLAPSWGICSSCSSTSGSVNWYRNTGVTSPSVSGSSARHHIGGTHPYADILWNNHLVGSFSSVGLPDYSHTLTNNVHNLIY